MSLDDTDDIYRLRLSGTNRLYGFLFGAVFYLLWWDPGHAVYPSTPRNT